MLRYCEGKCCLPIGKENVAVLSRKMLPIWKENVVLHIVKENVALLCRKMLFYCEGKCSSFVKENVVLLHGKDNIVLLHGKENVVLLGRKILRYFEGKCLLCYPPLPN